jgi:signal transduction histidine kinase
MMLIPAVAVCLAGSRLLVHEQERIAQLSRSSRSERARTIAETLQVTVDAVEVELQQALYDIPGERLVDTLLEWEATNPLIRNVFVWDEAAGLEYPLAGMASTAEERQFMDRFDGLFSGRVSWVSGEPDDVSGPSDSMAASASDAATVQKNGQQQEKQVTAAGKIRSSRQELVDLVQSTGPAAETEALDDSRFTRSGGWIPWFVENRLYILGWVRTDGPVYGVELELVTLLSRLITDFPADETEGAVYTLKDDTGEILHQIGASRIDPDAEPESILSLAPQLPHWELAVYALGKDAAASAGRGFLILSGLLLFIFLATILFGGGMLIRQAHRNQRDALRKTTFVSNVSHELKTPLTSIRMYAELLFAGRVADPDKKRRYLQVIVSETRRLTRLVNNVLDFSRLEQGQKKYHPETIHLAEYIEEVTGAHALPVKEAGMILETVMPDRDIAVHTDRDAIGQVMVNLIDNAVKYAADGGKLKISLSVGNGSARIEVADNGPGVSDAHRERIFEQFHRVDDSLTARQQGSGLGLSIARRILRDLGGDLTYRPGKPGGSCFVVSLPIRPEKEDSFR